MNHWLIFWIASGIGTILFIVLVDYLQGKLNREFHMDEGILKTVVTYIVVIAAGPIGLSFTVLETYLRYRAGEYIIRMKRLH